MIFRQHIQALLLKLPFVKDICLHFANATP